MLFESVAICEYLCDIHPNNRLLGESGSVDRAIHTQWASFCSIGDRGLSMAQLSTRPNSPEATRSLG